MDPQVCFKYIMEVRKYVDTNGLAPILVAKRSAGIAPELNLAILVHAGDEACKQGDPPWF